MQKLILVCDTDRALIDSQLLISEVKFLQVSGGSERCSCFHPRGRDHPCQPPLLRLSSTKPLQCRPRRNPKGLVPTSLLSLACLCGASFSFWTPRSSCKGTRRPDPSIHHRHSVISPLYPRYISVYLRYTTAAATGHRRWQSRSGQFKTILIAAGPAQGSQLVRADLSKWKCHPASQQTLFFLQELIFHCLFGPGRWFCASPGGSHLYLLARSPDTLLELFVPSGRVKS